MKRGLPLLLVASCLALACGDRVPELLPATGQVVLYVTTDAPLPTRPGEPIGPDEAPPLFDRLRIDILAPGSSKPCDGCSREFELDRVLVRNGEASVGIVPRPNVGGYIARVRLYRALSVKGGEPPAQSTIDVYSSLPVVGNEGVAKATVVLRVEDIGRPLGSLTTPTATRTGEPDFSAVGTWPKARRVPCSGAAQTGEACVPGGAFWMGHPFAGLTEDGTDASISRLVVVSPFYVDLHEVTVAEYRAAGMATLKNGSSVDPGIGPPEVPPLEPTPGVPTPDERQFFCDYTDQPFSQKNSHESLALNCISWTAASAFCKLHGKVLPSEAEWEYMGGGLQSDLFLWGQEPAQCGDAVWGRGGVGFYAGNFSECRPDNDLGGPLAPGNGRLDRLKLKEGEVLDLAGNVSEWTRDYWNRSNESCWAGRALLENPECTSVSAADGDRRTIKGGLWNAFVTTASFRIGRPAGETLRPQTGFRCIRPAR